MKVVTLLSGGLDSATLAYDYARGGAELHCLSFDYGQRHRQELEVAASLAEDLNAAHHVVTLGVLPTGEHLRQQGHVLPLATVLKGSSLTDPSVEVPDGHYASDTMKATVVPNRNAIMLSIAYGVAVAEEADIVAFAAHAGDHAIYPDCRPEFVGALNDALRAGNAWDDSTPTPFISAPYLTLSKADIATFAWEYGVPIGRTWSCYKGGAVHCGVCGTCYERREALKEAQVRLGFEDPTTYLDSTTTFEVPAQ